MPPLETMDRYQKAVLWSRSLDNFGRAESDAYGQPLVGVNPPVEIKVRWNDKVKEVIDQEGSTIAIDALLVVNIDIPIGSAMWEGGIDDLPGTGYLPEMNVMVVVYINTTKDIKGRNIRRTVGVKRSRDSQFTQGA